jgi:uncharacterized protein with PIN domain
MSLVLDTSVIIAVITNEAHKRRLIELTKAVDLMARKHSRGELVKLTPASSGWAFVL